MYVCFGFRGVRRSSLPLFQVVYVTATVPYLLIGAFLWRALTLPGANNGLQYFFKPQWELLLDAQVELQDA